MGHYVLAHLLEIIDKLRRRVKLGWGIWCSQSELLRGKVAAGREAFLRGFSSYYLDI